MIELGGISYADGSTAQCHGVGHSSVCRRALGLSVVSGGGAKKVQQSEMPSADVGGVAAYCRDRQTAAWPARREYELLKMLAEEGSEQTRCASSCACGGSSPGSSTTCHRRPSEPLAAEQRQLQLGHRPCPQAEVGHPARQGSETPKPEVGGPQDVGIGACSTQSHRVVQASEG